MAASENQSGGMSGSSLLSYGIGEAERPSEDPSRKALAFWQFILAGLVVLMILIGGLTRLTDSGLSITEWNLVTGFFPPLSEQMWLSEFEKYKRIPEFIELNYDMTLGSFKVIYWWEWGHRFLGRIVGLVFLVPFILFWVRGHIPKRWTGALLVPGVLIAVQGAIGWWMVSSGLTERVDVAPYRLATHLGVAFLIFGLLVWNGLKLLRSDKDLATAAIHQIGGLKSWTGAILALAFIQILSGALVAGLDAGRGYTDWPAMNGYLLPPEATELRPFWVNVFENPALAQFDHRILAYLLFAATLVLWWVSRKSVHRPARRWMTWTFIAVVAQSAWGVLTLVNGAPWNYAIFHQFGAVILLFILLRARFEVAYPGQERPVS